MAIELVTGHTGTEHVTAAQAGLANAGVAGTGMYVFDVLDKFKCTVASANSVTIGTGMARINGRDVASESATSLSVANGVSGQNRNDLVVARYTKTTSTGVESVSLVVINGTATTGTPSDPSYNTGSIIDGKTTVDMPLWRLPINGVSVGTPVQLFTVLPSLKALGDSVSRLAVPIEFTLTPLPDSRSVSGVYIGGFAFISIYFEFANDCTKNAWENIEIANAGNVSFIGESFVIPATNVADSHNAHRFFYACGNVVSLRHSATFTDSKGMWHFGTLVAPAKLV